MKIGIDFDNTIACYDTAFFEAALEKQLVPATLNPSKSSIRNYLRESGKEELWTELQGYIYGARMDLASPFPGVEAFFSTCRLPLSIISHKTLHPYRGPRYFLHEAARGWISRFPALAKAPAFFELTLAEKLARIAAENCTVFIDDLPELLHEPSFPSGVRKILFDPHDLYSNDPSYVRASSWDEIRGVLEKFYG